MTIKKLTVFLNFGEGELEVGELIYQDRTIFFRYSPEWIKTGIQISPIKLPLSSETIAADPLIFDGLFGV